MTRKRDKGTFWGDRNTDCDNIHVYMSLLKCIELYDKKGEITVYKLYLNEPNPRALPLWLRDKEYACSAGDTGDPGSIPGWGRSPGGVHGNPLQYPCLENPIDRGAWRAAVYGVAESERLKQLSTQT